MIWSKIPNEERLHLWKKLRADIKDLPTSEKLVEMAKFCETMPRGPRSVDYYDVNSWPTPWEILFHGEFCKSSVSLLIFHTLTILQVENIELRMVKDNSGDYLLPFIEDQFVLNYELGKVSNSSDIQDYFIVMKVFPSQQIKTIK